MNGSKVHSAELSQFFDECLLLTFGEVGQLPLRVAAMQRWDSLRKSAKGRHCL